MKALEHLVIDGDQMIFACGFAAEGEPESHAFHLINQRIQKSLEMTDCKTYTVYIKGTGNFREEIDWEYKANRSGRKPGHYQAIVDFLVDVHEAKKVDGMEADDKVSLLLMQDFRDSEGDPDKCKVIVSSPDKDLKNTPGWHLNPMKDTIEFYTLEQAQRHLAYQMLMGDSTDNIKGINKVDEATQKKYGLRQRNIGKKSAETILKATTGGEEALQIVGELYGRVGHSFGYCEQQLDLLWMGRDENDGFNDTEPCMRGSNGGYEEHRWLSEGYAKGKQAVLDANTTAHMNHLVNTTKKYSEGVVWTDEIQKAYKESLSKAIDTIRSQEANPEEEEPPDA